jgi:aquaporin Z
MKNILIAEVIGTYFLALIIGLCALPPGAGDFTPLAVTIGLAALVYSCGHISKAHFNPATTISYFSAGDLPGKAVLPYMAAIFFSATLAAWTLPLLYPEAQAELTPIELQTGKILLAEFLFTFILMWVILNVAIAHKNIDNGFYGVAIGAIVGAGAYAVGPISFAAFNPAITLFLCIAGFIPWSVFPLYCIVQALAAAAAGLLFRAMQLASEE